MEESFARGTSPIHKIAPTARLTAATGGAVCLASLHQPEMAALGLALALVVLAFSRPPAGALLRRLAAVNLFLLLLWLTVPFTTPGAALADWGALTPTREGTVLVLLVTLKANALVMLFLALVASMSIPTLGAALERLGLPARLVALLLFSYRYIHVLAAEWQRLYTAARIRGFVARTNAHTYRTIGTLLGVLFLRSLHRADRIYEAMRLRGFSGHFHALRQTPARAGDKLFGALLPLCCAALMLWEAIHD